MKYRFFLFFSLSLLFCSVCSARTVVDSRGIKVKLPEKIKRVITVNDGFIEGVIKSLGVKTDIVATGSKCTFHVFDYTFNGIDGSAKKCENGQNPVGFLIPELKTLPVISKKGMINYEKVVSLNPDVVIVRQGSCAMGYNPKENERSYKILADLNIPTVVLQAPNASGNNINAILREIEILGEVFDRQKEAKQLSDYLNDITQFVQNRTKDIPEDKRVSVLLIGPSSKARSGGMAGGIWGESSIENHFIENIVHAKNAMKIKTPEALISAERILSANPDVLILATAYGYHPPYEIYMSPDYQNLKNLKAVKEKRVFSLPWSPCNCEKRLEYPIDIMVIAKSAYPELFEDIDMSEWIVGFYQKVYKVNRQTAETLKKLQWME
jgi:iron complex transport system substrate-binding protein